jgi:hypothetical protein
MIVDVALGLLRSVRAFNPSAMASAAAGTDGARIEAGGSKRAEEEAKQLAGRLMLLSRAALQTAIGCSS